MIFQKSLIVWSISIFFIAIMASGVNAYSLGVSPSVNNVGELPPGATKIVSFYIGTSSTDDILIRLESESGSTDFFTKSEYKYMLQNFSEEDASSWIEFINNPVTLEYSPTQHVSGTINRLRKINMILKVPEDAEPGYHLIIVRPYPYNPTTYGSGVNILSITPAKIIVQVTGNAIREGKILDITNGEFLGERLEINTVFLNTGTVTISTRSGPLSIYDSEGNVISEIKSSYESVTPGKLTVLKAMLDPIDIVPGEYDADTTTSFVTGSDYKSAKIQIGLPSVVFQEPEPAQEIGFEWLIIVIVIIVAYIVYRRGRK